MIFTAVGTVKLVYEAKNGETLEEVQAHMENLVKKAELFPLGGVEQVKQGWWDAEVKK